MLYLFVDPRILCLSFCEHRVVGFHKDMIKQDIAHTDLFPAMVARTQEHDWEMSKQIVIARRLDRH